MKPALRFLSVVLVVGLASVAHAATQASESKPLFRDFMGLNGHTVQFRPKLYRPVAELVRDYHPVEWDLGKDSDFNPPFPFARNRVDWRAVYGSWHRDAWRIDVSLMFETLPREQWKDLAADTRAYGERFARAFGPSFTNAFVESVEIGNEPGKFSDADYRILFENMARGFKAGDPSLRVATCALTTGKSHDYAKSVSCISGLTNLYEILNVHTYAQVEGWPTWKRSHPEDPQLKEYLPDVLNLCAWRDKNAPEKEVWITEFGYDASTQSPNPNTEFKKWIGVTDEQQAQWSVRSWLLFAALPVQRAYIYFFNDSDEPQVHGSSGLTRNFEPKPVFHAAAHLYRTLGDYRFSRIALNRPGEALIYEFDHATEPERRIWVAWSPTGEGKSSTLDLPPTRDSIDRIELMPLAPGEPRILETKPGMRSIPLSESPAYIFLRKQ